MKKLILTVMADLIRHLIRLRVKPAMTLLLLISICLTSQVCSAQKWVPGTKGLDEPPQTGVVFNDNIYLINDKGDVLLLMGDTSFIEVATLTTKKSYWKLAAANSEMYLIEKFSKNNPVIYSFDGKKIKDITPTDSVLSFGDPFVFNEQLFINVEIKKSNLPFNSEWDGKTFTKNLTTRFIMVWDGKVWSTQDLKTDFYDRGCFFSLKNVLYYQVNNNGDELLLFKQEKNGWVLVLKTKTELYPSLSIGEFNSLAYFYDGNNETYFTFDGTNLQKKTWALRFDNYSSSEMFFIPFDNKLYLAGHFWCDVKGSRSIICFNGKRWKSTGTGLERYITVFLKNKETLYAFGMEDGYMFSTKFVK